MKNTTAVIITLVLAGCSEPVAGTSATAEPTTGEPPGATSGTAAESTTATTTATTTTATTTGDVATSMATSTAPEVDTTTSVSTTSEEGVATSTSTTGFDHSFYPCDEFGECVGGDFCLVVGDEDGTGSICLPDCGFGSYCAPESCWTDDECADGAECYNTVCAWPGVTTCNDHEFGTFFGPCNAVGTCDEGTCIELDDPQPTSMCVPTCDECEDEDVCPGAIDANKAGVTCAAGGFCLIQCTVATDCGAGTICTGDGFCMWPVE